MEGSQSRTMLALAVALVVVMAVLFAQGDAVPEVDPDATVRVWQARADAVERVELRSASSDPVVLRRHGDGWLLEGVGPADPARVDALLAALERVERGVPVEEPGDAEEYGLGDAPDHVVVLTLGNGLDMELRVGRAVPTGYRTYAQAPRGPIVAVQGDLNRAIEPGPTNWRDDRVFRFDPGRVRRMSLRSPGGTLVLAGEGTRWVMEGYGRADPDKVDDIVMGVLDVRFDAYLDPEDTPSVAGGYAVRVELADGSEQALELGENTPMGVVASTGDGRFGTIYEGFLEQLGPGPSDVGDPRAFPIDHERVEEVLVEWKGRRWVATRNGPTWSSPLGDAASWQAVHDLSEVGATYRAVPPAPVSDEIGLVSVRQAGQQERIVTFGPRQGDFYVARDAGGGGPYRVVAADLEPLLGQLFP